MIYAMWWGGCSYSYGELERDLEIFASIKAAGEALRDRYDSNGCRTVAFRYADERTERTLVPAVTAEDTQMDVFLSDPRDGDDYPDVRLTLGPRLGIRRERY